MGALVPRAVGFRWPLSSVWRHVSLFTEPERRLACCRAAAAWGLLHGRCLVRVGMALEGVGVGWGALARLLPGCRRVLSGSLL